MVTKKQYREYLNEQDRLNRASGGAKWHNGRLGARKRLYGDYLYQQDPDMFNVHYNEWKSLQS